MGYQKDFYHGYIFIDVQEKNRFGTDNTQGTARLTISEFCSSGLPQDGKITEFEVPVIADQTSIALSSHNLNFFVCFMLLKKCIAQLR